MSGVITKRSGIPEVDNDGKISTINNIPSQETAQLDGTRKITPEDKEWPKDDNGNPLSKSQMRKRKRHEKLMEIKRRKKQQDKDAKLAKAKAEGRDLEAERRFVEERTKSGEGRRKREEKWKIKFSKAENTFKVSDVNNTHNLIIFY